MEESRTLGWKLGFKYCTKSDTIIDVINSQSLWQNTKKRLAKQEEYLPHRVRSWFRMLKKTSSPSHNLEMKTIWLGARGKTLKSRYKNIMQNSTCSCSFEVYCWSSSLSKLPTLLKLFIVNFVVYYQTTKPTMLKVHC